MKEDKADIFTTDYILSTLMSGQKSTYSWDIQVSHFKGKVFLDKRDEENILDFLPVNETT